jgi:hypothetical protein
MTENNKNVVNERLLKKIEELLEYFTETHESKSVETIKKYLRLTHAIILIIAVIIGFGASWGVTNTKIDAFEKQFVDQHLINKEQKLTTEELKEITGNIKYIISNLEKIIANEIHKNTKELNFDIHQLQIKQTRDDHMLKDIFYNIEEIKQELKNIRKR